MHSEVANHEHCTETITAPQRREESESSRMFRISLLVTLFLKSKAGCRLRAAVSVGMWGFASASVG